jgi:hypothetical protein
MADAQNKLYSVNGAADALGKDRRTIDRALVGVLPDGYEGKAPRWRLSTIVRQLERRQATGNRGDPVLDELERIAEDLEGGLVRVRAEPDLATRRKILASIGPLVGQLDDAMKRSVESCSPAERALLDSFREQTIGGTIGAVLELGGWQLDMSTLSAPE